MKDELEQRLPRKSGYLRPRQPKLSRQDRLAIRLAYDEFEKETDRHLKKMIERLAESYGLTTDQIYEIMFSRGNVLRLLWRASHGRKEEGKSNG